MRSPQHGVNAVHSWLFDLRFLHSTLLTLSLLLLFGLLLAGPARAANHAIAVIDQDIQNHQEIPSPDTLLSEVATPFPVEPNVEKRLIGWTEYNTFFCTLVDTGTWRVTTAPTHGTLRFGIENRPLSSGPCAGVILPFHFAYYTWTDNTTTETQDSFSLRWFTSDGRFVENSDWLAELSHCDVQISSSTNVIRGKRTKLNATLQAHPPAAVDHVEWTFTGGKGGTRNTGQKVSTVVTMVDGQQAYSVSIKVFRDPTTVLCQDTKPLTVMNRTGRQWTLTPTVAPDNESGWGTKPTPTRALLGMERDHVSNANAIIIPSPDIPGQAYDQGYTVGRVRDPNGPNDGYFYITKTKLKIDQETVINRWIKRTGPRPAPNQPKWYKHNATCPSLHPATFLAAVKGHENSGIGAGATGHFGLIRDEEAMPGMDPNQAIEVNADLNKMRLMSFTNNQIGAIEGLLQAAAVEAFVSGNWPGTPGVSFWDPLSTPPKYSPCNQFMRAF